MTDKLDQRCETCRYWLHREEAMHRIGRAAEYLYEDPREGHCQRYPPQIIFEPGAEAPISARPKVWHRSWCGEWAAKTAP